GRDLLGLAPLRPDHADARRVLRRQRLLLRAAHAPRPARGRTARPGSRGPLRARARARVLGDVADHPDRGPADRVGDLAPAERGSAGVGRGAAGGPRRAAVAALERTARLRLARRAVVRRPLVVRAQAPDLRLA